MKAERDYTLPPGEWIREWLEQHEMTQAEMARHMGVSLKHLNQLIGGKVSLTYPMAWKLQHETGISARQWAILEAIYRTDLLRLENG